MNALLVALSLAVLVVSVLLPTLATYLRRLAILVLSMLTAAGVALPSLWKAPGCSPRHKQAPPLTPASPRMLTTLAFFTIVILIVAREQLSK